MVIDAYNGYIGTFSRGLFKYEIKQVKMKVEIDEYRKSKKMNERRSNVLHRGVSSKQIEMMIRKIKGGKNKKSVIEEKLEYVLETRRVARLGKKLQNNSKKFKKIEICQKRKFTKN